MPASALELADERGVRQAVRDVTLRQLYRVGYRVLQLYAFIFSRPARAVKCVITHQGEVLLVRHTYGPRVWHIPGGGSKRDEPAVATASREMEEELGLSGLDWESLGAVEMRLEARWVTLGCLHAEVPDRGLRHDRAEIAEAGWFATDRLPAPRGADVDRVLALLAR